MNYNPKRIKTIIEKSSLADYVKSCWINKATFTGYACMAAFGIAASAKLGVSSQMEWVDGHLREVTHITEGAGLFYLFTSLISFGTQMMTAFGLETAFMYHGTRKRIERGEIDPVAIRSAYQSSAYCKKSAIEYALKEGKLENLLAYARRNEYYPVPPDVLQRKVDA